MKNLFAIILILGLGLSAAGCRENYYAEKEFWKAEKVLGQISRLDGPEALEPAVEAFKNVAERYPSSPKAAESLIVVANVYAKQKRYAEARAHLRQFVQNFSALKDKSAWARYRMAQLYEAERSWDEAERTYWELTEYHPLHIRGLYAPVYLITHYARSAEKDEKALERTYTRALDHYDSLIKHLGPIQQSATPRNYLALSHMAYGEWQEAINQWLQITAEYPKTPQAPMALLAAAELAGRQKDYEQSTRLYGRFFKEYPDHDLKSKTKVALGMLHAEQGDYETARAWFYRAVSDIQPLVEKDNSQVGVLADLKMLIANSFTLEGDWPKAQARLDELARDFPTTSAALQAPLVKARYYQQQGDLQKRDAVLDAAIKHYREVEAQYPDLELAQYAQRYRASALTQKEDWDGLLAEVEHYYETEDMPERKGRWMYLRALITENRLRDNEKATELYNRFLSTYPNHQLARLAQNSLEHMAKTA